jgi:hypothetical protein
MDSNKLGKYLYDTNITLHNIIIKRIEKEGGNLPLEQLGQLIDIHLTLNDKINGYIKGMKQSELFNTKSK